MRHVVRTAALLGAMAVVSVAAAFGTGGPAKAAAVQPAMPAATSTLNGSGSSWAAPAIEQWSEDVRPQGIVVNYAPNGSQEGRSDFTSDLKDFAGSDIAFLNGQDKIAGGAVETSKYGYSYLPITAGGTAFMYHLTVGGKQITNLRLSGDTVTKIFTGQITNWDDPRITRDYGAQLPNEPITPVIRSDGSGATAQFTGWMNNQYPSQWDAFCAKYAHVTQQPCGETEFYPSFGDAKAQGSSTAVANYITASFGEGAIGYDEYAYSLESHYPVVRLENKAGYYVLPSASNVAVALNLPNVIDFNQNDINYLTEDLRTVYSNPDPRAYPISSYSYLIVPRVVAGKPIPATWSAGKGAAMSSFANYFLCSGQKEMAQLGYSPLPINLVQGGFRQVSNMPSAIATPASKNLAACGNPTFVNGQNILLKTAPYPTACDKVGSALYGCGTSTQQGPSGSGASGGSGGSSTRGSGTTSAVGAAGSTAAGGGTGTATKVAAGSSIDPATGQQVAAADAASGTTGGGVPAQAVLVDASGQATVTPGLLTALAVLVAVAAPPTVYALLRRRGRP